MLEMVSLDRALCLPAIDIAALLQGQLIAIIPNAPVQRGWTFALYPYVESTNALSIYRQYHQHILPLAQATIAQQQSDTIAIEAWAKCVDYKMLYEAEQLEALSRLTIWTKDLLKSTLQQRQHLLLAFLQVYRIPEPIKLPPTKIPPEKFGKFVGLPILDKELQKPIKLTQLLPVLSSPEFAQRKQQLEKLEPPLHPELEDLHSAIAQLSPIFPAAKALEADLKAFLGWTENHTLNHPDVDLLWISSIAKIGNSSDGYGFEKLVRKSLIKLGFSNSRNDPKASLDPEATGGAGGIDFYCDAPYPVVGECKATGGTTVPSKTPGQLLQLGKNHLQADYDPCIKIIVLAGDLTIHAELTAKTHHMNIIRPETLQRLTVLKVNYPGSIDLLDLKKRCLEVSPFGEESDLKLNKYIDELERKVRIRFHLIEATKQLGRIEPDRVQFEVVEIRVQYNHSFSQSDGGALKNEKVHELLIELASPLIGYLGRVEGIGLTSDRFYYLRDLKLDPAFEPQLIPKGEIRFT